MPFLKEKSIPTLALQTRGVRSILYQRKRPISEVSPSLVVGDKVRISIHKRIFEKEAEMNWSEEIFEITEVIQSTSPFTYKIKDLANEQIKGSFYRQQLKKNKSKYLPY